MVTSDMTVGRVKRAEIKATTFVVEHNLPFQVMGHFSDLVRDIFPDSKIASQFKCKHIKFRRIVKHVLADTYKKGVFQTLQETKFPIIIDESTDISSMKQLALVVCFFCKSST